MGRKIDKLRGVGNINISWVKSIGIGLSGILISYIIFLMIEVFWVDLIRDSLSTAYEGSLYTTPFLILMIGIGMSMIISILIFVILLSAKKLNVAKLTIFWIIIITFILTFITMILISFITIEIQYPEIFSEYNILYKLILIFQYISYYAIYVLESPVLMWDITAVVFGIYIIILVKIIVKEYKPRKRVKPLYKRNI